MEERIAHNVFVEDEKLLSAISNKWPAMVVVSQNRVTEQQAAEILMRTDYHFPDFTWAGNDKHHGKRLNRLFGIPEESKTFDANEHRARWNNKEDLKRRLGVLELEYVGNAQIVSAWIGGPHGWCDWDGHIFSNNYNIGKWPEVSTVAQEWGKIAEAFPFLDLRCQLFDDEVGEGGTARVEFVVSQGVVVVTTPRWLPVPPIPAPINIGALMGSTSREWGITVEDLRDKLRIVYGEEVPQYGQSTEDPTEDS